MCEIITKAVIGKSKEFIIIEYVDSCYPNKIFLPSFKLNSMYKNMELEKEYTIEELEL